MPESLAGGYCKAVRRPKKLDVDNGPEAAAGPAGQARSKLKYLQRAAPAAYLLVAMPASAGTYYEVDLVTPPASFSSVDSNISINQKGTLAFVASDAADGMSKVFISPCALPLCPATAVSFFGSGRQFMGASINNASPPSVLSVDRFSGAPPSFFLRTWSTAAPGTSALVGKTPDLNIGVFTSSFGLTNQGKVADVAATAASFAPELLFYDTVGGAPSTSVFSNGTLLRAQVAKKTSDLVLGYHPTGTASEVLVYGYPGRSPRFVAGSTNGYTNIGQKPGISDDGLTVGFYGTSTGVNQVAVEIGYNSSSASSSALKRAIALVAAEGKDGVTSLAASASNSISVYSRQGRSYLDPLGVNHYFHLVSVVFAATVAVGTDPALAGLYSRDLLVEMTAADASPGSSYAFKVLAKGAILPVARTGDTFGSVALSSGFAPSDTVATFATGNAATPQADLKIPVLAFSASDASGHNLALRAVRSCAIPATAGLPDLKQKNTLWSKIELGFSQEHKTIGDAGCRLTDISDVLAFYLPKSATSLTPQNVNELLKRSRFTYNANGSITFPGTRKLKVKGFSGGNVAPEGVEALSGLIASLNGAPAKRLSSILRSVGTSETGFLYTRGKVDSFDKYGHLVGTPPKEVANINSVALSPYIDFFECNQEPVIIKVLHCKPGSCSKHFVVGTGKRAITVPGRSAPNVTSTINDPGFRNTPPTDLINTFAGNHYLNTSLGVESYTRSAVAGSGGDTLSITAQSPVTLLLTDPAGRQIGIDPVSGLGKLTIPNATFVDNSFDDPDALGVMEDATEILVGGPTDVDGKVTGTFGNGAMDGAYTLDVVGTGTGPYTIQVTSVDDADKGSTMAVTSTTSLGQHDTFTITRTGKVGVPVTIVPR